MPLVQCNNYRFVNTLRSSKDGASSQILMHFFPCKIIKNYSGRFYDECYGRLAIKMLNVESNRFRKKEVFKVHILSGIKLPKVVFIF